ncbi:hypothetical protein EYZ11_003974 [Aspergillus tanneri]|uniref:Copper-fist domain-containing protein n=1 Tax=Aspergillus tanneri TaxID=1220188 RepID=A0A4S3JM87_9EURO|nr:hypothetical protein EYZ11_003974 [Aspergillus tanneri]
MPLDEEGAKWSWPVYQVPADAADPAPTMSPASIAPTPSPGPGKIQKSSRKQVKTAPENIAKALHSIPEFHNTQTSNGTPSKMPPYIANSSSSRRNGGSIPGAFAPQGLTALETSKSQTGSCCSRAPQPPSQVPPQSSCCKESDSPVRNGQSERVKNERPAHLYSPSLNGNSYIAAPTPQLSPWQDFHAAGQNHYMHPFTLHQPQNGTPAYGPDYLSRPRTSSDFSNHGSSNIGFNQTALSLSIPSTPHTNPTPGAFDSDPNHDCTCGDSCQCLGCASHPFNSTTRQHVQEMGLLVALDGQQTLEGFNGFQSASLRENYPSVPRVDYSFTDFNRPVTNGASNDAPHVGVQSYGEMGTRSNSLNNGYSSPPSEYASGQPLMEPSEYYTLEYPVGLPPACSDVTGSCQCGNDCCCVGCLTHSGHNGLSLETASPEAMSPTPVTAGEAGINTSQTDVLSNNSAPSATPML